MDNTDIFMNSVFVDKICLNPKEISSKFRDVIELKIKSSNEGKCTKHGFIKPNSVEILKISPGNTRMVSLNGDVIYNVQYTADVCNPCIGTILKVVITNINKFGILAEASIPGMDESGNIVKIPVVEVIITKHGVGITGSVALERLTIGNQINVEVLGKKYELNDKKICAVGRVVEDGVNEKGKDVIEEDEGLPDGVDDDDDDLEDIDEEDENDEDEDGQGDVAEDDDDIDGEDDGLFDLEGGLESDLEINEDDDEIDDVDDIDDEIDNDD